MLAGCTIPFLHPGGGPVPLPGTPDLGGLAFVSSTPIGTPSPLPTATPSPTRTPHRGDSTILSPTPTYNPYHWACADDGSPDPCHRVFRDIAMLSDGGGWIVGERGVILRREEETWAAVASPVDLTLRFVRIAGVGEAWAVGDGVVTVAPDGEQARNVFLRWEGSRWTVFDNPIPFERVIDLSFVSAKCGWGIAAEESGGVRFTFLIRWDGSSWEPDLRTGGLNAVWMLSSMDGWAVGDGGLILHWDGVRWMAVDSPVSRDLDGIVFSDDVTGWITSREGVILRYGAGEWLVYSGQAPSPRRMVLDPDGNGWMFGSWHRGDVTLDWYDKEWEVFKGTVPDGEVLGLSSAEPLDFWAVGWVPGRSRSGMIWRWTSDGWVREIKAGPVPIRAAAFPAADDGWAVGDDGLTMHWDGSGWTEIPSPTFQTLNAAAFRSADDGWAAGEGGQILHWTGAEWSLVREFRWRTYGYGGFFQRIDALAFPSAAEGWAAGGVDGGGTQRPWILRWDGAEWTETELYGGNEQSPCGCSLNAMDFLDADDGWAVGGGEKALMMHWNGSAWTASTGPDSFRLLAVRMLTRNDVWAAGVGEKVGDEPARSLVLHYNGWGWNSVPLPAGPSWLDSIRFTSLNDGWMAGDGLLHWNGTSWGAAASPVESVIVTLTQTESGALRAVTDTGTVLELTAGQ
jgi:hypothetical protein